MKVAFDQKAWLNSRFSFHIVIDVGLADEEAVGSILQVNHEFPNGWKGSKLLSPCLTRPSGIRGASTGTMLGAAHVVTTSVGMCDVDLRATLYGNVVVTGFNDWLN